MTTISAEWTILLSSWQYCTSQILWNTTGLEQKAQIQRALKCCQCNPYSILWILTTKKNSVLLPFTISTSVLVSCPPQQLAKTAALQQLGPLLLSRSCGQQLSAAALTETEFYFTNSIINKPYFTSNSYAFNILVLTCSNICYNVSVWL